MQRHFEGAIIFDIHLLSILMNNKYDKESGNDQIIRISL